VAPAELRRLYVAPAHHGRGVADELWRQTLASLGRIAWPRCGWALSGIFESRAAAKIL